MSTVIYPSASAYSATPQTSWYISNYVYRPISVDSGDKTYTIASRYNNRPDLLAYDLYGNPSYWWIFCVRNPNVIRDPIWDFVAGAVIVIPSQAHLKAALG